MNNARFRISQLPLTLVLILGFGTANASANGFDDLRLALSSLEETSNVAGKIVLSVEETRGDKDDDDYEQNSGHITTSIDFSERGLAITYSTDVMLELEKEYELRSADEDAKTPTTKGLNELRTRDITGLISQSQRLLKSLQEAEFVAEKNIEYMGLPARELVFNLPLNSILKEKRTRDYVDDFESDYRVIIDEQGFPVASTLTYSGKGRAYIVLSFAAEGKRTDEYKVIGNRLVSVSSHNVSQYDSTFGKGSVTTQRFFDVSQQTASTLNE